MNMILRHFIWLSYLLFSLSRLTGQEVEEDTLSLDLDNLWDEVVWEEIEDVVDVYYEVEQITPVAGVRGAEAEDEALEHLYYRKSMKGIALIDLQKAYGKLYNKLNTIKDPQELKRVNSYLSYLRKKIKKS